MPPESNPELFATDDRGVSEVVAVVLLIGIVLLGMAVILFIGGSQLATEQNAVEIDQAEQSLTQFDSEAARVASGGTSSQQIDLGLRGNRGTLDANGEAGNITVEYDPNYVTDPGNATEVMNESMGTVIYENGETTVGYQGGGVWRSDGQGSTMVSPPEIALQGNTLTMPVIRTNRNGSIHSDVGVSRTNVTQRFPTDNKTNRIEGDKAIIVTIESRYCGGWETFFSTETDAIVNGCEDGTVEVVFLAHPEDYSPDVGVVATSGMGSIELEGNGAYVDSYRSPGYEGGTSDAVVEAAGDIALSGDATIEGEVQSGGKVEIESASGEITDDVRYVEGFEANENAEHGTPHEIGSVETPESIKLINKTIDGLDESNVNDETAVIDENGEIDIDGEATLEPGHYHLENFHLDDETLRLNATADNITIGVEDWLKIEDGSEIVVEEGEGEVQFVMGSGETTDPTGIQGINSEIGEAHFVVDDSHIHVPENESPRLQVFGPKEFVGAIGGGGSSDDPEVTAAVIAPADEDGTGEFYVKHGELYGAVMTGDLTLGQGAAVHFDEALTEEKITLLPGIQRISYFYLSDSTIAIGNP